MSKINLGCGMDYRQGWKNWDISEECKTDAIVDIRQDVFPAEDGEAELVYVSGVFEQIASNEELVHAMNECHRCLQDGGTMEVVVPNAENSIAWQDPFDVRKFVPKTFDYFIGEEREYKLYGKLYGFKPWSSVDIRTNPRGIMEITMVK